VFALFRLELHAERFFQCAADSGKRRKIARAFHPRPRIARIRGEEERHVFWIVQRRGVKHHAL